MIPSDHERAIGQIIASLDSRPGTKFWMTYLNPREVYEYSLANRPSKAKLRENNKMRVEMITAVAEQRLGRRISPEGDFLRIALVSNESFPGVEWIVVAGVLMGRLTARMNIDSGKVVYTFKREKR